MNTKSKNSGADKSAKNQANPLSSKTLPKSETKKADKKEEKKIDPEQEKKIAELRAEVAKRENEFADAKSKLADSKKALKALTGSSKKESKGPGVIKSILTIVTSSGKKGVSKKEILDKLIELFPDHASDGMEKTINVQLPGRMSKERGIKIEKLENGNFYVAKEAADVK